MQAIEYLKRIKQIDRIINNNKLEIERWQSVATSLPSSIGSGDKVQTSHNSDKMANAIVEYVTLQDQLTIDIINLSKERNDIIDNIKKLDSEEYDILYKTYVQYLERYEVADSCGKSLSWVKAKHRKAIENLQVLLDSNEVKK